MAAAPPSMRAAVLQNAREFRVERRSPPILQPGQVRIAVEGCGVCASSLPLWSGRPWFSYPQPAGTPGHEGWGEIVDAADDVEGWRKGDRVAFLSDRAFAEEDVARADAIARLPSNADGQPLPGEPLACAMNVMHRARIAAGMDVAVVGVGFIGALLVQLADAAGARVVALSRRAWAREVARACGASETLGTDDPHAAINAALELTGGRGFDRVIEAAGEQVTLDIASALCGEGARLVVAGYHQDGPRQVDMQQWNWRGIDVINAHERDPRVARQGVLDAAASVEAGWFDPSPLYTHQFPLEQAGAALDAMIERPPGFVKALVTT